MTEVRITGLGTATPPLRVPQEETYQAYVDMLPMSEKARALLQRVFVANNSIGFRHFGMESLADVLRSSQDELIARYQKYAVHTAVEAATRALEDAGLAPDDLDGIVVNSCTGYLCPGLTSYVSEALGLRAAIRPYDLQGMGCGGAVPNLETAYNYLQAHPGHDVLSIAVEICSATMFHGESPDLLISNALFGDGAAAAVLSNRPGQEGPCVNGFASGLYPQDRQHLYYRTEQSRLRNVLSVEVPAVGARRAEEVIGRLLEESGIAQGEVDHWILHPGGQKVIDALQDALALPDEAVQASRKILYEYGNMSSASVLFVLNEVVGSGVARPGDVGVMCSFGAGFGVYAALLEF
ncbi:MAG TPA: type III polyketide synthase [Anaerolineae bacterium]|nr:type III polyketide synthase [Anaerolineae bacterium]